jgi:hypothetical protein
MKRITHARAALAALIGAFALSLAACNTDVAPSAPTAPDVIAPSQPASDLLGLDLDGTLSTLVLYKCPTDGFGSVSQQIGPGGGTIRVGPHSLVVPAGALTKAVTITATAPAGNYVKVDFEPEGLGFAKSAGLTLSYAHCNGLPPLLPKVVYLNDLLQILEVLDALHDRGDKSVTAKIRHFSGYAIAD